jgi:hypothetical protein
LLGGIWARWAQGPTDSFDELNSIEGLREADVRVNRMYRRSRSAWGSAYGSNGDALRRYNDDAFNDATSHGTENPVVYGQLRPELRKTGKGLSPF